MAQTQIQSSDYREFIHAKRVAAKPNGFEVEEGEINPLLFAWQRDIVRWALHRGRAAIFADCGLGKTLMQLEFARHVHQRTGGRVLILAPILVGWQTLEEAQKFSIQAPIRMCRSQADVADGINVTNYERLHLFDAAAFSAVVLDDPAPLKNFMGVTRRLLKGMFAGVRYKLDCIATPAPNDLLELGNHADFLDVMPSREMIARWFINDTMHAGKYRLKPHGAADFWRWVSSWAVALSMPSDLGHSDEGYTLPPLNTHEVIVKSKESWFGTGNGKSKASATNVHKEKRSSLAERCDAVAALCNESDEQWAVWCGTDYEADALKERIRDCLEVRGPHKEERKEAAFRSFAHGDTKVIVTKDRIAGWGLNWQHCHNTTWFAGYSFESFYQAIRRMLRFGQKHDVNAYVIASERELPVLDTLISKVKAHADMRSQMGAAMRDYQIAELYGRKLEEYQPCKQLTRPPWLKSKSA